MKHLSPYRIWLSESSYGAGLGDGTSANKGAGVLPYCPKTGKFLASRRSESVSEPGTWGTLGGKMEIGESPKVTAGREMQEECGYAGKMDLIPLQVYRKNSFSFHNFLAVVPEQFVPVTDPEEVSECKWVTLEELKEVSPMHYGLRHILEQSSATIDRWVKAGKSEKVLGNGKLLSI